MTVPSIGVRLTREQILAARLRALGWSYDQIALRLSENHPTSAYQVGGLLRAARKLTGCPNDYALAVWTVDHLLSSQVRTQWAERARSIYAQLIDTKSVMRLRLLELATDPAYYHLRNDDLELILNKEGFDPGVDSVSRYLSTIYTPLVDNCNRLKLIVVCHLVRTCER